jgi:hypothetical protein
MTPFLLREASCSPALIDRHASDAMSVAIRVSAIPKPTQPKE